MSKCSWRIGTRFAQRRIATDLGSVRNTASAEHRAVVARARGEQQKRERQLPGRDVLTDPVPGESPRVPLKEHLPSVQDQAGVSRAGGTAAHRPLLSPANDGISHSGRGTRPLSFTFRACHLLEKRY